MATMTFQNGRQIAVFIILFDKTFSLLMNEWRIFLKKFCLKQFFLYITKKVFLQIQKIALVKIVQIISFCFFGVGTVGTVD